MTKIIYAVLVFLLAAAPALAQGPTEPTEGESFQGDPFEFTPVDYSNAEPNAVSTGIQELATSNTSINAIGSTAVSIFGLLDNFAGGGVFGYAALFMAGIFILLWLVRYVFQRDNFSVSSANMADIDDGQQRGRRGRRRRSRKAF